MAALKNISKGILRTNLKLDYLLQTQASCGTDFRCKSYSSKEYDGNPDPAPIFFNKQVQSTLHKLTRIDLTRVYKKRKLGESKIEEPTYKFLTDQELKKVKETAIKNMTELLQIPPVISVRKPVTRILSKDSALQGLETSRFIFTDITFGVKDSERLIVARNTDGTLCEAEWSVRDRMNQIYFPNTHRQLRTPKVFEGEYFENILNRQEYEFILDFACMQFEPNDLEYQRVVTITYQHLNDQNAFNSLRSTRHFGSLAFFLVWHKNIDNLLLDLIETSHILEAAELVELYGIINNIKFKSKSLELVEEFIKENSNKKAALELALQSYKDIAQQKEILEKGIRKAHGMS